MGPRHMARSSAPVTHFSGLADTRYSLALFGAFLGLGLQTRRIWLRYLAPLTGLVLAIAAHMLNNALPLFLALAGAAAGVTATRA